ncbi:hypothetical protein DVW02_14880 [Clostridium botulinum]|nr:hypothetical protein [Clostridium botulinum]
MNSELKGKKLLILGATSGETTLVKRAKSLGIYTIVTDSHTDYELSPAKKIADEAWDISWSDIDTLEKKCKDKGIDGVTAGYSEFRVENLIKLCKRMDLPCYATEEHLEITRDKIKFKNECRKNDVPVVKEFACVEDVDEFPVIVKPVDRAGSIGISIATNKAELKRAYSYAMDLSVCKQVIIEKYMQERKIDVYYAVENGDVQLISSCDTIAAQKNGTEKVVQSCWLYPMKEIQSFNSRVDGNLRKMIANMHIQYGCIFFSGFVDQNNKFVFFECGFRMEGAHQYNYVEKKGLFNFLDLFIYHSLLGRTDGMKRGICENKKLKCAVVNIYAKDGVLSKVSGIEEIASMDDCCLTLIHGRIGQKCEMDKAILSKIAMFSFCNESAEKIMKDVKKGYKLFSSIDQNGKDMIYDYIDTEQIIKWWK